MECIGSFIDQNHILIGKRRVNSEDSRYVNIGNISEKEISGKVFFRIAPRSSFGLIK